ncbi:MAG: hypothetical protein HUU34_13675 [Saprospiraceae bacterium]|nr:hypothetical protein [Saprospiraceae bacterium]
MSNKYVYLIGLLLTPMLTCAQGHAPGGVFHPVTWYVTVSNQAGEQKWKNLLPDQIQFPPYISLMPSDKINLLNFNEALSINTPENDILFYLNDFDLSRATFFIVCHPIDMLSERIIWSYEKDNKSTLVLTTHRMADLESFNYMNFEPNANNIPSIKTYHQFKSHVDSTVFSRILRIGEKGFTPELPVSTFKGILPEFIIFDRVLDEKERIQVESYLAIKYGISLDLGEAKSYLNSEGNIIWNTFNNKAFSFNITGIGRDDHSNLYQKQSTSANNPGLLVLSAGNLFNTNGKNPTVLPNMGFLLWGDNNAYLDWDEKVQGQPVQLLRKWLMTANGDISGIKTEIRIDTKKMGATLSPNQQWWISIDRSSTGQFQPGEVEYFKGAALPDKGVIVFDNIQWDTDCSGQDYFTFCEGPEMMAIAWISAPTCVPLHSGKINVSIVGGVPPYNLSVSKINSTYSNQWTLNDNRIQEIENVQPGTYYLNVRDADGILFRDTLYIQAIDAPVSNLYPQYDLHTGQLLRLDATTHLEGGDISYAWTGPNGFHSNSPIIEITEPGNYQLIVDKAGCSSYQNIEIVKYDPDVFEHIEVFPNPTSNGYYAMRIQLKRKADVVIDIADLSGHTKQLQTLQGNDRYWFEGKLPSTGSYIVTLRSQNADRSFVLIGN